METAVHDPLALFNAWYQQAKQQEDSDADTMALATATHDGRPSVRMVLFKGFSQGGFLVFTNYQSRKGQELADNPRAALAFYWPKAYRQVRIEGYVQRLTHAESEAYFQSRPRGSQIAASISAQSQPVPSRDYLLERYHAFEAQHPEAQLPCPEEWGGFRVVPEVIEFWQGQEHRLHDRFIYRKHGEEWDVERLAP